MYYEVKSLLLGYVVKEKNERSKIKRLNDNNYNNNSRNVTDHNFYKYYYCIDVIVKEVRFFCGLIIHFVVVDSPAKRPYSAIVRVPTRTQVTLFCPVDGRPDPNITWYKGNDTTGEVQHQGREWTFQAESNDSGWYSCSARNFLNPFKPVNASFQLIVGKFSWVLITILSGNNIAILLINFIVIFAVLALMSCADVRFASQATLPLKSIVM